MNTDLETMRTTDAIDTIEVITGAARDMVARYDRALICLALVGIAGLSAQGMFTLGLHPVLTGAVACGFGGVITLGCISVVWGRARFVRPLSELGMVLAAVGAAIGLIVGLPLGLVWMVLPEPSGAFGSMGIGAEWLGWQAVALGAVCVMVAVESTMLAWALRSTSGCRYLDAGIEMLSWPVERQLYNRSGIGALGMVLALGALWIPGVALLVPVYVAMFAGNLFYRVWALR